MSLSTTSQYLLNISRDENSTTSMGSQYQCVTTLSMKKFLLTSNLSLHWCNVRPFPHILSLFTWEKATAALVDGAVSCTDSVPLPPVILHVSSGQLSAFRLKTITSPTEGLILSPDDKCSRCLCHLSRLLAQVKALKLSLLPMSFLWSTKGLPIPIFLISPTSSLSCTEILLSQSYLPVAADSWAWWGAEMPAAETKVFAEPRTTLPVALFHAWGKAVCSRSGTVIKYHGFCKHLVTCRLVLSHDGWLLFYLQVINQLEVQYHEKERAAISQHPMKCCNSFLSLNLICSSQSDYGEQEPSFLTWGFSNRLKKQ